MDYTETSNIRRVLIALVVAATVVVAGCAGGPAGTDTQTSTPSDVPTDTPGRENTPTDTPERENSPTDTPARENTPTDTPASENSPTDTPARENTPTDTPERENTQTSEAGSPPGIGDATVTNVTALKQAHYSVLEGSSFRIDTSQTDGSAGVSFTIRNGTGAAKLDVEEVGSDGSNQYYITENVITQFNNSRTMPKVYSFGSTSQQFGAVFTYAIVFRSVPAQELSMGTFEVDGTVTRDGEELTRLSATGVKETATNGGSGSLGNPDATLTDMSGEVLVRSDGLVREMNLEQTFDTGVTQNLSFTVSGLGNTSVTTPDWIDEAPRLEGSLADNGTVMELSHTGGPAVPANTTLTLSSGGFGGGIAPTNVTSPGEVAPGESIYIYATGRLQDPTVMVSADKPTPTGALNLSGVTPQVSGTVGDVQFVIGRPNQGEED